MIMFGWCENCQAVALEGWCCRHGETKPISQINKVDVCPLPQFEKEFLNDRLDDLFLGEGIFLVYGDRINRRIVVALDKPLVQIRVKKGEVNITSLASGEVEGMNPSSLLEANSERLNKLVRVSKSFAAQELEKNKNAVISFSGGKDSLVLAHLLEDYGLKNVLIDTTIEFPETYRFIEKLKNKGWDIEVARAEKSFFKLLPQKGYPERRNRWCCKTQKFEPFENYLKQHFGDTEVLVFGGERRWESLYRMNEPFKRKHAHITNQYSVHIMLDWTAMDSWMYIWKNNLPVNEIYQYYDRAGCWPCPFGLTYRSFIMEYAHPKLHSFLEKVGATSNSNITSILPCTEGKPKKHVIFSDRKLMKAVAKLLPNICTNFEVHAEKNVICIPSAVSKTTLRSLVGKARADFAKRTAVYKEKS